MHVDEPFIENPNTEPQSRKHGLVWFFNLYEPDFLKNKKKKCLPGMRGLHK